MTPFSIDEVKSNLFPNEFGKLRTHIIQAKSGRQLLGKRKAFRRPIPPAKPTPEDVEDCHALLSRTQAGCLNVISPHPAAGSCTDELRRLSNDRTIVLLAGLETDGRNALYVASGGVVHRQSKLSLSSDDIWAGAIPGDALTAFAPETPDGTAVNWVVLNCHDYTNADILLHLLKRRVELIVIVTDNNATRLYWEYAVADIHRLFCHVVIVNVAELGGSGVFAPFRRLAGQTNAQFGAGGQLFGARGPAEATVTLDMEIGTVREMRQDFATKGFEALSKHGEGSAAVVPSEHFMHTLDRPPGPPPVRDIEEIEIDWSEPRLNVGVAQLGSMPYSAYFEKKYRIRLHPTAVDFNALLRAQLNFLRKQVGSALPSARKRNPLHMLVFPEVFVPRTFERELQEFSDEFGTTVVCGVDYPDGDEPENANECLILRPYCAPRTYRKITRSQYDACVDDSGRRMKMQRGDMLLRFVDHEGRGFGLLVCYDYSHLDLVTRLNCEGRHEPLEVLFVVAHNPFGNLYRSCCLADSHRFYQYIVMCNVTDYGGSGVFAPMRTSGSRQTILDIGKGTETISIASLDLAQLRKARASADDDLHGGEFMRKPGVFLRPPSGREGGGTSA